MRKGFRIIYDFGLFILTLVFLPKCIFELIFYNKYRKNLFHRLGLKSFASQITSKKVIWIHAASLGEAKASITICRRLKESYPKHALVFSSVTETGFNEIKSHNPYIDQQFYLPLDFSFSMKRLVQKIKPQLFISIESEFWPNLFFELKKMQTKIVLVNGKISKKSFQRFLKLKYLRKFFFDPIDLFCLQNEIYQQRFQSLNILESKIHITGNIKFDNPTMVLDQNMLNSFRQNLGFLQNDKVITLASTHPKEEKLLLASLDKLLKQDKNLKVILVPRHPERCKDISHFLNANNISFVPFSHSSCKNLASKIVLIDQMGLLNKCYQISTLAVIGGSFVKIGGHNLIEPVRYGIPTFYGPYIFNQLEFSKLLKTYNLGFETTLFTLPSALYGFLSDQKKLKEYQERAQIFTQTFKGSSLKTMEKLKEMLNIIS